MKEEVAKGQEGGGGGGGGGGGRLGEEGGGKGRSSYCATPCIMYLSGNSTVQACFPDRVDKATSFSLMATSTRSGGE